MVQTASGRLAATTFINSLELEKKKKEKAYTHGRLKKKKEPASVRINIVQLQRSPEVFFACFDCANGVLATLIGIALRLKQQNPPPITPNRGSRKLTLSLIHLNITTVYFNG